MKGWHIAATVCGLVSLLLLLTALGSDHWLAHNNAYFGLWKICVDLPLSRECTDFGINADGYVHATRAFLILGAFAGFISCGTLCALIFCSEMGSIRRIAMISSYVAGVLVLIAMATYTGASGASRFYSWSFGLGWACVPLFLLTGGLTHMIQT